jgi:signal transduction histidine kinase/DNA-binding NarL/FixJ family response regulator
MEDDAPQPDRVFEALARLAGALRDAAPDVQRDLDEVARWVQGCQKERAAAEHALAEAMRNAEAASLAKNEFLSTISHEIRTPLNGVLGMTRLLLAETMTAQQRKYVQLAEDSASSLLEMIEQLLDLGQIEAGRLVLEQEEFRLDELVSQLGELYTLRAEGKGLRCHVELGRNLPRRVRGDRARLRQVLNHLLSNALKFTTQGEIGLLVGRADSGRGPDMVRFTVYDTGIGIPPEIQRQLFMRFAQADSSTTRRYGGNGLGLAIVKQLCEQMGGTVLLQSEPGRGASFRCELPLPAVGLAPPAPAGAAPAPGEPARAQAAPRLDRVLLAEDNPTNQLVVKGVLAQAGYHDVTVADDGEQAVAAVASGADDFDIVLMDCRMPRMDGYEATRQLRRGGFLGPIIALTANASADERERCLAVGMDDYLTKPLDGPLLVQVLAKWSRGTAATPHAAQGAHPAPAKPAPAPPPPEPTAGERARALERLGGDATLLAGALASFRQHAPGVVLAAREALAAGQVADVHRHLHSLAGSSSMVGALAVESLARRLEQLAGEGRLEEVAQQLATLEKEMDHFLDESLAW